MNYAVIQNGVVVNSVVWNGDIASWTPPTGCQAVASSAAIGYTYDGTNFFAPTPAPITLPQAQASQLGIMVSAYQNAISQNVTFTTAGSVTESFTADPGSISNVQNMLAAYSAKGVPTGFYWLSVDNVQVTFTLADLQSLAKAMGDQGWAAFQHLQAQKASILAATTVAAVQAIVW